MQFKRVEKFLVPAQTHQRLKSPNILILKWKKRKFKIEKVVFFYTHLVVYLLFYIVLNPEIKNTLNQI